MLNRTVLLPCGASLPNRICKTAMTEGLSNPNGLPSEMLARLYAAWSDGGAGLLITGNVQIDSQHLERPGNIIIEEQPSIAGMKALENWAAYGTKHGNQLWAQISHAGRQTPKIVNPKPNAPSSIRLKLPSSQFGQPIAMTNEDIEKVIIRFANCANVLKTSGFTGVQVHAAHGYLLSQFLSPLSNVREDIWGGSLKNRCRLLLRIVQQIRDVVGSHFPISVKLNSADFQRGGFDFDESMQVAKWLSTASVDLIEVSGGNYEQPKLLNIEGLESSEEQSIRQTSKVTEGYFIDFARAMRASVKIPIMVTGGLRRRDVMIDVLKSGSADVIGIGRPLCVLTDGPRRLLKGSDSLPRYEDRLSLLPRVLNFLEKIKIIKSANAFATQYWFYEQISLIGKCGQADPELKVLKATIAQIKSAKNWIRLRASEPERTSL